MNKKKESSVESAILVSIQFHFLRSFEKRIFYSKEASCLSVCSRKCPHHGKKNYEGRKKIGSEKLRRVGGIKNTKNEKKKYP